MSTLKKLLPVIVVILLSLILAKKFLNKSPEKPVALPVIAITQIIEHSALDQERQGMIEALAEAGYVDGKTIKIHYQNAQGNISTATQIVNQMLTYEPKVMVAISTPSAQAALGPCQSQNVPMVFTAVTDPLGAKLIKNLDERTEAVTGISDQLPISSQLELVKEFIPDLKTLGIIYNAGEVNSVNMVKALREEAEKYNIEIVEATASKTSDVNSAMNSLVGKVQAVYVPNDNTAVAAMSSIAQVGEHHQLPVFAGDTGSVVSGAVATKGYNRLVLGRTVGEILVKILKGTPAGKIPVLRNHPLEVIVNKSAAKKMNVKIPESIEKTAAVIGD